MMSTRAPLGPLQVSVKADVAGVWARPSWSRTTIALMPCFLRFGTSALIVSASSRNSSPATPEGVTIVGVPSSVRPMNAIFAPPNGAHRVGAGRRSCSCRRRRRSRRGTGSSHRRTRHRPGSRRSGGSRRSASGAARSTPSSNSWLPTALMSSPSAFSASIVGSSWKAREERARRRCCRPPTPSACSGSAARSCLIFVARYSTPPA